MKNMRKVVNHEHRVKTVTYHQEVEENVIKNKFNYERIMTSPVEAIRGNIMTNYSENMEHEIEITPEMRERACKAEQTQMTVDVQSFGGWNMANVVLTDEIAQVTFSAGGRVHFFTRKGFEKYAVRFLADETIKNNVQYMSQRDGKNLYKRSRDF